MPCCAWEGLLILAGESREITVSWAETTNLGQMNS